MLPTNPQPTLRHDAVDPRPMLTPGTPSGLAEKGAGPCLAVRDPGRAASFDRTTDHVPSGPRITHA